MASTDTPIHVLIGMPSFRGTVTTITLSCIVKLTKLFTDSGVNYSFINVDAAEIVQVRNNIASNAYRSKQVTHLLFIDDDMAFEPDAILDLLRGDKAVAGLVCPKRSFHADRFFESAVAGASFDVACADATDFIVRHFSNTTIEFEQGWFRLAGIGMGITLIRRDVLDDMVANGAAPKRGLNDGQKIDALGNTAIYGFFDPLFSEETNTVLSEDLSFCERYRLSCGGEIWANAHHEIGHVGQVTYKGRYMDRVKTGRP